MITSYPSCSFKCAQPITHEHSKRGTLSDPKEKNKQAQNSITKRGTLSDQKNRTRRPTQTPLSETEHFIGSDIMPTRLGPLAHWTTSRLQNWTHATTTLAGLHIYQAHHRQAPQRRSLRTHEHQQGQATATRTCNTGMGKQQPQAHPLNTHRAAPLNVSGGVYVVAEAAIGGAVVGIVKAPTAQRP